MFQNLLHLMSFLVIIVCCFNGVNGQIKSSPCPDVFQYRFGGKDGNKLFGLVFLPGVIGQNNVKIKYAFDEETRAIIMPEARRSYIANNLQKTGKFVYQLQFSSRISTYPDILSITLNNREFCDNSDGATYSTINVVEVDVLHSDPRHNFGIPFISIVGRRFHQHFHIQRTFKNGIDFGTGFPNRIPFADPVFSAGRPRASHYDSLALPGPSFNTNNCVQGNWLTSFKFNCVCGRRDWRKAQAIHTVINGRDVDPHEFPWLAALFDNKRVYFCGGSLVSDRHVISAGLAAHCTADKQSVVVEFGKHDLDNLEEKGVAYRRSESIANHPEYKPNTGHADISIITLSEKVTFSDKISPICLWPLTENPVGLKGTVAGWGKDRSGEGTNTPMAAQVDIVSDSECRNSHELFSSITSETTFCAGGQNKGPCVGDSGSGFVLERGNRWFLKGITSTSIGAGFRNCNVNKPAVYCDVGKYLNWLKTFLLSE